MPGIFSSFRCLLGNPYQETNITHLLDLLLVLANVSVALEGAQVAQPYPRGCMAAVSGLFFPWLSPYRCTPLVKSRHLPRAN